MTPACAEQSPQARWHFLQSDLWAEHKSAFGWTQTVVPSSGLPFAAEEVVALTRQLPGGLVFTYVPYAPAASDVPDGSADTIVGACGGDPGPDELDAAMRTLGPRIAEAVRESYGREPAVVRFDLPQQVTAGTVLTSGPRIRRSGVDVQPPETVIIDLGLEDDTLLAAMHKKNRYNIRLASRKGVTVRRGTAEDVGVWYAIYRETAERDAIAIHSRAYYGRLFELAAEDRDPRFLLYFAEHDGDLLAGIVVVHHRRGATYLYGASSDRKRELMPNYALQWRAMLDARAAGCGWYDLFGIPPADDPEHPMHGLYRFKTGFGGSIVRRLGAWDYVVQPGRAGLLRTAESIRYRRVHRGKRRGAR